MLFCLPTPLRATARAQQSKKTGLTTVIETAHAASAIALAASICFALSNHVQHIALDHMDVRNGTIVNVGTTAAVLWLLAPFYLVPATLVSPQVIWFALAGLIVPSLSMTLQALSVRTLGPGLTSGLSSTSPVFAMIIAVVVLGEVVTGQILLGTAVVVASIAYITLGSRRIGVSWPMWAVAIPLGAALARGLVHNMVKFGLTGLPSPMTAALVGATTSLVVLLSIHFASGRRIPTWNRGYFWFACCGVLNGGGLIGLNTALGMGDVVVVSPLIATTPAFTILTGWLFFRREVLRWSSIAAIAMIFVGCMMIIMR